MRNEYTYDHQGRLIDTKQKTGDNASTTNALVILSRNSYNEIGQLIGKGLHGGTSGTSFAQTVKYRYNPRGWLSSQSAPLFAMELKYEQDSAGVIPQYNDNITMEKWGVGTGLNKTYSYVYDGLDRLTSAVSHDNNNEVIAYSSIGNITSLQRKSSNSVVDQLSYVYNNSNRLASVSDGNANTSAMFPQPGTTNYS